MNLSPGSRKAVATLTLSLVGFMAWQGSEGFTSRPAIPTKGDVPTIGHGSTRYENGEPVRMTDAPISRKRAEELARNLNKQAENKFIASLPGVSMTQEEFDLYMDFVGQYGITNWRDSSMRRELLSNHPVKACDALLLYKRAAGYDCSIPGNNRCAGVWTRQLERHKKCLEATQ